MANSRFVKFDGDGFPQLDIGACRHVISIMVQSPFSPPEFDLAGQKFQWTKFTTAIAAIDQVRGTDVIRSGQTTTQLYLTVAMQFQPGILPSMRIDNAGNTYIIQSVENVLEMSQVLVLNCLALGSNE